VAARQGRTDDAIVLFDQVDKLIPDHPSVARARGDAYAAVWRWEEAVGAYRAATVGAPNDSRAWRGLAQALGSLGRRHESLAAAQSGLGLEPRDPHLLRSQSLAYSKLAPGSKKAKDARRAWLDHRRDELAPSIKGKCKDPTSDCQKERVPIFARQMK
jgi:predicted Zn-dependent protease